MMTDLGQYFAKYNDNSYVNQLVKDPESDKNMPNNKSRPVKSGHYVIVRTTAIKNPVLVSYSRSLAQEMNIGDSLMIGEQMLKLLYGFPLNRPTWATPYALSIFGQKMIDNCPYKNDTGYGDGRAISIGEFVVDGNRYELQLKGAGTTPFSRGADGRAVLRSSIREYLASEAMNALRVPTVRCLSLVVSESEKVNRPWYKNNDDAANGTADGTSEKEEAMFPNKVAIVCRVASSFIRIGTLELFSRRCEKDARKLGELKMMFKHMMFREYPECAKKYDEEAVLAVLREFSIRLSYMVAEWMRVGYVQGNFNSDNCAVSGKTLDYGPFGFIELYKDKNFWSESAKNGDHFNFFNQPKAAKMNFMSFADALRPLVDYNDIYNGEIDQIIDEFDSVCAKIVCKMWSKKLGLVSLGWNNGVDKLFSKIEDIMLKYNADYTMFWRQLCDYPMMLLNGEINLGHLMKAFYDKQCGKELNDFLVDYRRLLMLENRSSVMISRQMKQCCPKYIPREWMLATAYTYAEDGDYEYMKRLEKLFAKPYDEQPEMEAQFYRLIPLDTLVNKAGIAYMTCAS